jgi:hypothetical protein
MIGMREIITKDYDLCDGLKSSIYIRFCAKLNTKTVGVVLTAQTMQSIDYQVQYKY